MTENQMKTLFIRLSFIMKDKNLSIWEKAMYKTGLIDTFKAFNFSRKETEKLITEYKI